MEFETGIRLLRIEEKLDFLIKKLVEAEEEIKGKNSGGDKK